MSLDKIIIPNHKNFEELKNKIKEDGVEKLHILSDFDRTLTYGAVNGVKTPSIISMLRDGNHLTNDYAEQANALFEKYHPVEIDTSIPLEDKKRLMQEWWHTHNELLINSDLSFSDLQDIVNNGHVGFRDKVDIFLDFLYQQSIPLIILSASGCGDAIQLFFKKINKDYSNIHYITNQFNWDNKGQAVSSKEPIIHVMNKNEIVLEKIPEVYQIIQNKKNVILIGDSLGDLGMIEGFNYDNLIKIGFLNLYEEDQKQYYLDNFDVILTSDGDFSFINELIKNLIDIS